MRWILLLVAIVGFAVVFTTKSPGALGLGLLFGFVGMIGFVFALAADRIAQTSQPETVLSIDPEVNALRVRARQAKAQALAAATRKTETSRPAQTIEGERS